MNIVHEAENIHIETDGLRRWAFPNTLENHAYVPKNAEPEIQAEGINITAVGIELFKKVRESYKKNKNCNRLTSVLDKNLQYAALVMSLDDIWKKSYDDERYHLFDGIL
ncbi:hypothetical protein O181_007785 [Austropuccinia psidii MF-1]|uniref:Uncharacterized protein n=1 Tax=Austropuccinia psidii MF-1 TaxID=1389203 RepID=A0A9Q3GI91_9BASI|nr:hypothetical protein [Austropuccinia psidii MF-1]